MAHENTRDRPSIASTDFETCNMFSCEFSSSGCKVEVLRGKLQNELFPIEREIVEALYEISNEGFALGASDKWNRDAYWTYRVKSTLHDLGQKKGFLVYPERVPRTEQFRYEWLFDLVWLETKMSQSGKHDWKETRGLKMACESEWLCDEDEILGDFLKLTFAFADVRLFVYTNMLVGVDGKKCWPADICRNSCPSSRGFRYLLVGYPNSKEESFRVDMWVE